MNTRKVLPEVKGGGERKRVLWFQNYRVGRKQRLVMGRAWAGGVGGGSDLLNEGETGWQQQYEGEGCGE